MTRPCRTIPGLLAALVIAAACGDGPLPEWTQDDGYRWRPLDVGGGKPGFTPMAAGRTGVDFENRVSDSLLLLNRNLAQGAGVAIGDIDSDSRPDIFLARTDGCSALYRNLGGWKFEDVALEAGVAACDRHSTGAAFVDFDGDGDLDLILVATRGPNAVFVNDGRGTFTERRDLGVDTTGKGGTTIAMADVDRDGDLDLFVANYNPYNVDDSLPPAQRSFDQVVRQTGANSFEVAPEHRAHYRLVHRPDMGGLRMSQRGATDDFYLNEGGRFTRIPFDAGRFRGPNGEPIDEQESFTLMGRFADLNSDGAPDLYVGNDFEDLDELWFNDGQGRFRRAGWTAQRQMSNSAMGVDVGDVNGDGLPDLFEVDMLSNDAVRLKTQIPTHTALPKIPGDLASQLQQQRNTLFLNRGDETFAEVAAAAGVEASGWSWSAMFLDVDLDGWQDILITNGHLWDMMDGDTYERLRNGLVDIPWRRLRWQFPPLRLRNVAYRNRGDMSFEDASATWGFGLEEDISHAIAGGDLDGDGDHDVVINRLGSPALLLRNDTKAPRVGIRLVGTSPNTMAVGAKARLLGGAVPVQEREITAGGLYLAHSDYEVAFAAGASDSMTIVVVWPGGHRSSIDGVRANRLYEITEPPRSSVQAEAPATPRPPEALFVDATAALGGHTHVDPPFNDWARQLLLPNALSQLGPGVAFFDHDRDGDEDLFVGAGRTGHIAALINAGNGRFTARVGPRAEHDVTTIVGLIDEGGSRLLAGISSWEAPGALATSSVPGVVGMMASVSGIGAPTTMVGPAPSATGPIALADYDGDGDLDLFVGGRAVPAAYPRAASSQLLRMESGRYVTDSANAELLAGIGLVSAAIFADIDADGDPDLLLAREWDSILLLLNQGGRFTDAPASYGLEAWTSRWNGIATGDLDSDGRLDIVATSWGRNTAFRSDRALPLIMLHGPFGAGGQEEMLLARHDEQRRGLVPLNSFPPVRSAIPDLPDRIRTYGEYSSANVNQVLGPATARAGRREIVTLDHMVFLNRGDHFEARPLPWEAQLAPAFYAGVADFDGDGREDIFLAQNFSPTAVGLPRYDAGRGLLLKGDGRGGLEPVSAAESGLRVYGDMRGAAYADIDADGRVDIAVSQNAAETRLFRNRGAAPGYRVRVVGPASNPLAIGAQVRLVYGERAGPVREIQAGSGYWSQNGAIQVFGLLGTATAVRVRWPGGQETVRPVPAGAKEISVGR